MQFESQSLSCIRGGSHFRVAFEPAMVVRDDPAGPPCAAPFKGRDSQSACHPKTPSQLSLQAPRPAAFSQRAHVRCVLSLSLPQ